jgi:hypothetical protein
MSVLSMLPYGGVAVAGWLAGMLTFKRSTRWCPVHGVTMTCAVCADRSATAGRQRA